MRQGDGRWLYVLLVIGLTLAAPGNPLMAEGSLAAPAASGGAFPSLIWPAGAPAGGSGWADALIGITWVDGALIGITWVDDRLIGITWVDGTLIGITWVDDRLVGVTWVDGALTGMTWVDGALTAAAWPDGAG